jgi:hypothetical protein
MHAGEHSVETRFVLAHKLLPLDPNLMSCVEFLLYCRKDYGFYLIIL